MKKNVVIPLDGSEFSRAILEPVIDLFDPKLFQLQLLRVTDLPPEAKGGIFGETADGWSVLIDWAYLVTPELHQTLDDQQAERIAYLERELTAGLIDDLRSAKNTLEHAGFDVRVDVRFGQPAEQIKTFANGQADFIAMATHGRSGLAEVVMGSVAKRVLHECAIPILMLRPSKKLAGESLPLSKMARITVVD